MMRLIRRCLALTLALCLLWAAALAAPVIVGEPAPEDWADRDDILTITVFKTYRSDAMLIQCGGVSMMVDGGTRSDGQAILPVLQEMGLVNEDGDPYVNILFGTHPHDDHQQGLYTMVAMGLKADEFITSFRLNYQDTGGFQRITIQTMEKYGIPVRKIDEPTAIGLGDARVLLFWDTEGQNPNMLSCMAHVEYGEAFALLTADATGLAQRDILEQVPAEWLVSDIMKMAHHGVTASVKEFITLVNPQFVFFTNTRRNEERIIAAISQVNGLGIPYMYNDDGRIVMQTDGSVWYVNQLDGQ